MVTNSVTRKGGKDSSEIKTIILDDKWPHQSLFPSLDLSNRYFNLSRVLSSPPSPSTLISQLDYA
jgi:hypothetical protein